MNERKEPDAGFAEELSRLAAMSLNELLYHVLVGWQGRGQPTS